MGVCKNCKHPGPTSDRGFCSGWCEDRFQGKLFEDAVSLDMVPSGRKNDGGKLAWDLLLRLPSVQSVVRVLMHGAKKYNESGEEENWRKVADAKRRYTNALFRHATAFLFGEAKDEETGESHLAHAVCCCLFLMELAKETGK